MPGDKVLIRTRNEFKKYVANNKYVIVKVSATWCGPCKRCAPYVDELFKKMPEAINMVVLDADECADVCSFLKVKSVPTFITYVDGGPADALMSSDKDGIKQLFEQMLKHYSQTF
jgi:thioredoxin 1